MAHSVRLQPFQDQIEGILLCWRQEDILVGGRTLGQ